MGSRPGFVIGSDRGGHLSGGAGSLGQRTPARQCQPHLHQTDPEARWLAAARARRRTAIGRPGAVTDAGCRDSRHAGAHPAAGRDALGNGDPYGRGGRRLHPGPEAASRRLCAGFATGSRGAQKAARTRFAKRRDILACNRARLPLTVPGYEADRSDAPSSTRAGKQTSPRSPIGWLADVAVFPRGARGKRGYRSSFRPAMSDKVTLLPV